MDDLRARDRPPPVRHPVLPQAATPHVRARCAEHFNKTYGIVHPREQWESERNLRCAPYHTRTEDLGAIYFQAGGWERPHWYTSNAALVEKYGVEDRPAEWDARWWSPISSAEHLALRDRVGMVDLAPFVVFDVSGPGALDYLQTMTVNSCNVAVGRSVYTPLLDYHGGFRSDLTIMRLGEMQFRVVTGAFDGPRDEQWFRKHLPVDGTVTFVDRTSALATIGVWGPRARDLVSAVTEADLSNDGFPYGTTQEVLFRLPFRRLFRISYVGDLGWRSTSRWRTAWRCGTPCGENRPGTRRGRRRSRRVRDQRSVGEGYRLMGAERGEYSPVEGRLARRR